MFFLMICIIKVVFAKQSMIAVMPCYYFKQILHFPGSGTITRTRVAVTESSAKCGCFCIFEIIRAEERLFFLERL